MVAVAGVRRRLALLYAATFAASLLLLGPVLYLVFARQLTDSSDASLRLAAQRQALLAYVPADVRLGINPYFTTTPVLADSDNFYLLLDATGRLQDNYTGVQHAGLPDEAAAHTAARRGYGVYSTLSTRDAGDFRLFTTVIKARNGQIKALLQAGQSIAPLVAAQRQLLYILLALGAASVAVAVAGGVLLTREAMHPITVAFAAQRAFVADAAHELRTPLTLMRTNAEVLLEAGAVLDADDRALVEDIVTEAGHMGRLIGDLLTLARLDAGNLPLQTGPVALDALVARVCRQVARLAERHSVRVSCAESVPLVVQADAGRLEQVLLIVLDNAVKYNHAGGRVEVTVRRDGGQAAVAVRDSGRGIPAAELPHLFARFHRGRGTAATTEGHGLGLTIAQGIARAHRGRVQVDSAPGAGATVTLFLPLAARTSAGDPAIGRD